MFLSDMWRWHIESFVVMFWTCSDVMKAVLTVGTMLPIICDMKECICYDFSVLTSAIWGKKRGGRLLHVIPPQLTHTKPPPPHPHFIHFYPHFCRGSQPTFSHWAFSFSKAVMTHQTSRTVSQSKDRLWKSSVNQNGCTIELTFF